MICGAGVTCGAKPVCGAGTMYADIGAEVEDLGAIYAELGALRCGAGFIIINWRKHKHTE